MNDKRNQNQAILDIIKDNEIKIRKHKTMTNSIIKVEDTELMVKVCASLTREGILFSVICTSTWWEIEIKGY